MQYELEDPQFPLLEGLFEAGEGGPDGREARNESYSLLLLFLFLLLFFFFFFFSSLERNNYS